MVMNLMRLLRKTKCLKEIEKIICLIRCCITVFFSFFNLKDGYFNLRVHEEIRKLPCVVNIALSFPGLKDKESCFLNKISSNRLSNFRIFSFKYFSFY